MMRESLLSHESVLVVSTNVKCKHQITLVDTTLLFAHKLKWLPDKLLIIHKLALLVQTMHTYRYT